jgi:hypothetical protein
MQSTATRHIGQGGGGGTNLGVGVSGDWRAVGIEQQVQLALEVERLHRRFLWVTRHGARTPPPHSVVSERERGIITAYWVAVGAAP